MRRAPLHIPLDRTLDELQPAAACARAIGVPIEWVARRDVDGLSIVQRFGPIERKEEDPREVGGWYALQFGTPGWALNRIRSLLLGSLIADLRAAVESGLGTEARQRLDVAAMSLKKVSWITSHDARQPFQRLASESFLPFAHALSSWSQYTTLSDDAHRWALVCRISELRLEFATFVRRRQGVLAAVVGWDTLVSLVMVLDALADSGDDGFACLRRAVTYLARMRTERFAMILAQGRVRTLMPELRAVHDSIKGLVSSAQDARITITIPRDAIRASKKAGASHDDKHV